MHVRLSYVTLTVIAALLATPRLTQAEGTLQVGASDTLRDVLAAHQGKSVRLRLAGGDELEGKVALVGNGILHLSGLVGREFYDALVDIERIQAIIVRAR
jgi:hypothetical protein